MSAILVALMATALTQAPAPAPTPQQPTEGAAEAARRAADAAERAAAAAERSAKAAEELVRANAPQKPEEAAVPAPAPKKWNAAVGLSLIAMSGNSETLTFSVTGTAERRTEHWVLSGKLAASYGQSRVVEATAPQIVAQAASVQLRLDRRLTELAAAYLLAGFDTDHVKSLEARYGGEAGVAITWWERKEGGAVTSLLRTDLGLRAAQEVRFQYFPAPADVPDVLLVAPTLGIGFRYGLTSRIALVEEALISANVWGAARFLGTSLTRLTVRLADGLSLAVALQVAHDSLPAAGKKPTDAILSAGVDLTF